MTKSITIPKNLMSYVSVLESPGLTYRTDGSEEPFAVKLHTQMSALSSPITILLGEPGSAKVHEVQQMIAFNHLLGDMIAKDAESTPEEEAFLRVVGFSVTPFALASDKFDFDVFAQMLADANKFKLNDGSEVTPGVIFMIDRLGAALKTDAAVGALANLLYSYPHRLTSFVNERAQNRIIIPLTPAEWDKVLAIQPALKTISNVITLPEANRTKVTSTILIELGRRGIIEPNEESQIDLGGEVMSYLLETSGRYVSGLVQPGAAIKLAEVAYAIDREITINSINRAVKQLTNIDAEKFSMDLSGLTKHLNEKIVGQESAIKKIARGIKRGMISDMDGRPKPIYSVMAYGESGIGKTLLAETLAMLLTGDKRFLRIDAGELKSAELANARLLGMPIGYKGYENGGSLTEFARKNRSGVVLIDEIEKADPEVQDLFMRVIDTGAVTSAVGEEFDLTKFVFVFTTNAGVTKETSVGFTNIKPLSDPVKELQGTFKKEFLYRFDDILEFKPLTREALETIARRAIESMFKSSKERGYKVRLAQKRIQTMAAEVAEKAENGRQAYKKARERFADDFLVK